MTSILLYTALSDLSDLLKNTTNISNLPPIQLIYDEKTVGIVEDGAENIYLKGDNEKIEYFLHGDDTFHTVNISIDVWTRTSIDRLNDILSALFAYIKTNIRFVAPNTANQYSDLLVIGQHPQSDQYRGIFRHIIDIQMRKINP